MGEVHFTEEDKHKFVEFLNMIAKNASFNMTTLEIIQYYKLLSHMQQKILVKIDSNILEIKKVVASEKESIE